ELGLDPLDRPFHVLGATHVAGDGQHVLKLGGPEVQCRHATTAGQDPACHRAADVSSSAGDQRRAPREVVADGHRGGSVVSRSNWREEREMARPVTLFTGQWADLPLEELASKAAGWGFD